MRSSTDSSPKRTRFIQDVEHECTRSPVDSPTPVHRFRKNLKKSESLRPEVPVVPPEWPTARMPEPGTRTLASSWPPPEARRAGTALPGVEAAAAGTPGSLAFDVLRNPGRVTLFLILTAPHLRCSSDPQLLPKPSPIAFCLPRFGNFTPPPPTLPPLWARLAKSRCA